MDINILYNYPTTLPVFFTFTFTLISWIYAPPIVAIVSFFSGFLLFLSFLINFISMDLIDIRLFSIFQSQTFMILIALYYVMIRLRVPKKWEWGVWVLIASGSWSLGIIWENTTQIIITSASVGTLYGFILGELALKFDKGSINN